MKISIIYTLHTDGDYKLDNPEEFGCIGREVDDDVFYDYIGLTEFENVDMLRCKNNAKDFLWKFLCNGLHFSYARPCLLKDFCKLIESLVDVINNFEAGIFVTRKHISGNYDGTEFEVVIREE